MSSPTPFVVGLARAAPTNTQNRPGGVWVRLVVKTTWSPTAGFTALHQSRGTARTCASTTVSAFTAWNRSNSCCNGLLSLKLSLCLFTKACKKSGSGFLSLNGRANLRLGGIPATTSSTASTRYCRDKGVALSANHFNKATMDSSSPFVSAVRARGSTLGLKGG